MRESTCIVDGGEEEKCEGKRDLLREAIRGSFTRTTARMSTKVNFDDGRHKAYRWRCKVGGESLRIDLVEMGAESKTGESMNESMQCQSGFPIDQESRTVDEEEEKRVERRECGVRSEVDVMHLLESRSDLSQYKTFAKGLGILLVR
nr:hypothetical protein CFP56_65925 [Quercus suber]